MIPLLLRRAMCVLVTAGTLSLTAVMAYAQADGVTPPAGMLRYPNVSAKQIVFVYAGKLWVAPHDGGLAIPVATPPGNVALPKFSPDGNTIAFTGNYDGLRNIYTIPAGGGIPKRITHHPSGETLCNWTPDGKLLYSSNEMAGLPRQSQLYTVGPNGGMPTRLPVPYGEDAAISPNGQWLAYTPSSILNRTWKRYRGGWASDIWLFDLTTHKAKQMTTWEGTDAVPMWVGSAVYYLSDGGPEHRLNIWKYDTRSGQRRQITHLTDYDVKWPSLGPGTHGQGEVVFQYGADLDLLDLGTDKIHMVTIRVPGDRSALRPRLVDESRFITGGGISPTGVRAVVEARGDIWTLPAKEGSLRNLTHTSGVAERDPAWSPDGRWIAYFSDATGEYELTIMQSDGKGETRQLTHGSHLFYSSPRWSPDSKYIAYTDNSGALSICSVADGKSKLVATDSSGNFGSASWSPDSQWITYALSGPAFNSQSSVWIYNVKTGQARQVTSGLYGDSSPVFDHAGDYLYFASARSFEPLYDDMGSSWVYAGTQVLIAVPLRADIASPYLPKSDEESFGDTKKKSTSVAMDAPEAAEDARVTAPEDDISGTWTGAVNGASVKFTLTLDASNMVTGTVESPLGNGTVSGTYDSAKHELKLTIAIANGPTIDFTGSVSGNTIMGAATYQGQQIALTLTRSGGAPPAPAAAKKSDSAAPAPAEKKVNVTIDFDGFEDRAMLLGVPRGQFGQLAVNDRNQLIFVRVASPGVDAQAGIKLFDIKDDKKEEKLIAANAGGFDITPDGKKLLVFLGNSANIQDASAGATPVHVQSAGMTTTIDPMAEWKEIFVDAWRIEREFFYDPNMHGVNWRSIRDQYAKMVDYCNSRDDVGYVISEMISELNVGHAYYGGGDLPPQPAVSVGMLGADFELNGGAYRIAKIYRGGAGDVDARGPLSQPGVKVKEGDYLLAVNGMPMDTTQDPWAAFQNMAGRTVTLTVSSKPTLDSTARDVPITPLSTEVPLRFRAWIEHNRAYVDKQTGGKVGYVYVTDTGQDGQNDLVRQFLGQMDKQALIIDERWNGGGQIPDRFIELLNRPALNYWARRHGKDWTWPPVSHQGPKCMLINGESGSGGDAFPWYFRAQKIGKLIGMRTWGGLVGIAGNPGLIDGAGITAPNFGFYKPNGTWAVEGHGVDPDIEVVDDPALMVNGGDPQLDRAIQEMVTEIKLHPYAPPKKPAYPNRSGMGVDPRDR